MYLKPFKEYISEHVHQINERLAYSIVFNLAKREFKGKDDDFSGFEKLRKDPAFISKALEKISSMFGGKLDSKSSVENVTVRIANNSFVNIKDANYGDYVEMRLFVKGGLSEDQLKSLADAVKKLDLK